MNCGQVHQKPIDDSATTDKSNGGADPRSRVPHEKILGISFFNEPATAAVDYFQRSGGYMVAVAAPALIKLNYDEEYRRSLLGADLALADSGLLAFLWKLVTGRALKKISGLAYLKALLVREEVRGTMFWVLPSPTAMEKTIEWLGRGGFPTNLEDCYVAATSKAEDYALLQQIEQRKPQNIIVATPGGSQEKMGLYLRSYLLYRPRIHCIGAALGFLTGEERPIPGWADRYALGWLWRIVSQPQMLLPRVGIACRVAIMVFKYRSQLPPVRTRWADR